MIGAIVGDIAGSIYEFRNHRSKEFELLNPEGFFTDDTVMSLAICKALMDKETLKENIVSVMQEVGQPYPTCGYGLRFLDWMYSDDPKPYDSCGNGSAMRVGGVAWAASSLEEALEMSDIVTVISHDHPEGIKGARATAAAVYLARTGSGMAEIRRHIEDNYYRIDFTIDELRPVYVFDGTCQGTVPQAMAAFFESVSFEDAIRNAISVGGDSDTLAAITGSVAEAYYGVPQRIRDMAEVFLDDRLSDILWDFEDKYGKKEEK